VLVRSAVSYAAISPLNEYLRAGGGKTSRQRALRLQLSILVAGTMVPMLLFAVGLIATSYLHDREAAFERVMAQVRSIRTVLDSEVSAITAGLTVLALSPELQNDDLAGFRQRAEAFAALYAGDSALVLANRDGQQIINTRAPAGAQLPPRQNKEGTEAVFTTGRPFYSRVFIGSVAHAPLITIDMPVMREGKVAYVLSFNPPMSI
jgi:hypothetical protein